MPASAKPRRCAADLMLAESAAGSFDFASFMAVKSL